MQMEKLPPLPPIGVRPMTSTYSGGRPIPTDNPKPGFDFYNRQTSMPGQLILDGEDKLSQREDNDENPDNPEQVQENGDTGSVSALEEVEEASRWKLGWPKWCCCRGKNKQKKVQRIAV